MSIEIGFGELLFVIYLATLCFRGSIKEQQQQVGEKKMSAAEASELNELLGGCFINLPCHRHYITGAFSKTAFRLAFYRHSCHLYYLQQRSIDGKFCGFLTLARMH